MSGAALIVAHPGHELRVHHWLERARPIVFVLTDGSGTTGAPRLASTARILDATGATAGPVMGRFTDREVYTAMMDGDVDAVAAVVVDIADALIEHAVDRVVADSCEFYNPTHDLCRVVADLAVERARSLTGRTIATYDYAVVGTPPAGHGDDEQVIRLDDAALQRKIDAARGYPELQTDVENALKADNLDPLRVEALRRLPERCGLPEPAEKPYYEQIGEERVRSGLYTEVLRHATHFAPFVAALTAAVRSRSLTPAR